MLVIVLLDRLTGSLDRRKKQESGLNLLVATVKHLKDWRMLLVLPLTMFSGLEQAFTFGDFTQVKFVLICQNQVNTISLKGFLLDPKLH